jgi:hypothetical protein
MTLDAAKHYCTWMGKTSAFNATDSKTIPTKQNMRLTPTAFVSFTSKDGNIHLSPEGDVIIRKWLLLSGRQQETG